MEKRCGNYFLGKISSQLHEIRFSDLISQSFLAGV